MSRNSRLGYDGEAPIERLLLNEGLYVSRPRAGRPRDCGDFSGLPLVISAKNHRDLSLAQWCADLETMCVNAGVSTGVVWHKRRGKADPRDWYVTTTGRLWLPQLHVLVNHLNGEVR